MLIPIFKPCGNPIPGPETIVEPTLRRSRRHRSFLSTPAGIAATAVLLLCLFWGGSGYLHAQNLEGGFHVGYSALRDSTPLGNETAGEYGVWVGLWPTDRLAVNADWGYGYREDFTSEVGGLEWGEVQRNRQHVDLVLQVLFMKRGRLGLFGDIGGGSFWNNRHVVNPHAIPSVEEDGKESTKKNHFTVGGGVRYDLVSHLHWVTEVKFHNPGSSDNGSIRLLTGLTVSWR